MCIVRSPHYGNPYETDSIYFPSPYQEIFQASTPFHLLRRRIYVRIVAKGCRRDRRSGLAGLVAIGRSAGNPMDHNNLYNRAYKALLKKSGLHDQEFTFHCLRRTFGTVPFNSGEHPKVVKSLLGHTSIVQTMDTYSHLVEGIGGAAVGKLEQAFG